MLDFRGAASRRVALWTVATAFVLGASSSGWAQQIYINEVMFNAPNPADTDASHQYVELRGEPNVSLANFYLLIIEAEDGADHTGNAGVIETMFDLGEATLGSNGFLVLRQKIDPTPNYNDYSIHPMATDRRNAGTGQGFGHGATSSIDAYSLNLAPNDGIIEASGFTAMLIKADGQEQNRPEIGDDIDVGNDGMDPHDGWNIIDSIGVFAEENEADFGRVYSPISWGFEATAPGRPEGSQYIQLDWPELEVEYIGRWGNSTGHAPGDWHVSNITTNSRSGFQGMGMGDFRQSSDPHQSNAVGELESNLRVPYGTPITTTVGSPNYPLNVGDFQANGSVAPEDIAAFGPLFGEGGLDGRNFLAWQRDQGNVTVLPAATPVPEPHTALMATLVALAAFKARRRRCS